MQLTQEIAEALNSVGLSEIIQLYDDAGDAPSKRECFLDLTSVGSGQSDAKACEKIGPRIKSIAEPWQAAPSGEFGWRGRALDIADALEIAAKHPDIVFEVLG